MVKIKTKKKIYEYDKKMETLLINTKIKDDFKTFCKKKRINKSKLIEEFYKTILLRFHDGSLNASNGYITINILRSPISKCE